MTQDPLQPKEIREGSDPAFSHIEAMIQEAVEMSCSENKLSRLLKTFTLSREIDFIEGMAISCYESGVCLAESRQLKEALNQFKSAEKYYIQLNQSGDLFKTYISLSKLHSSSLNFDFALDEAYKALQISESAQLIIESGKAHACIADTYMKLEEFSKSLEHFQIASHIFNECKDDLESAWMDYHSGRCYLQGGELDAALNHLEKARSFALQENIQNLKQAVTAALAEYYIRIKKYEKALEYFTIAIDAASSDSNLLTKAKLLNQLGELHLIRNDLPKAGIALQSALKLCINVEAQVPTQLVYKNLSELAQKHGQHDQALEYFKKYIDLCRVINQTETNLKIKGIELKFDIEKLIREKNQAEKNAYIKDQFLAGISHEIRTPLHGIQGMANLLMQNIKSAEDLEYIKTIKLSANNLIRVFEDLFDFAKINSGEIELREKEFSLKACLTDELARLNQQINDLKINPILIVDENIPDKLIGDETRLHTILNNVLQYNANLCQKGNISIEVQIKNVSDNHLTLLFIIQDDDSNMPEEKRKYLSGQLNESEVDFNRFYEGQSIGLIIVKQLIELQQGKLTINKNTNGGTQFNIELSFRYNAVGLKHSGIATPQVLDLKDLSKFRLLLVEDNKLNQFLTQKILSKLGFQVDLSENSNNALELITQFEYHTILMDVNMPGINGYELTQLIRKTGNKNAAVPIIALTAYTSPAEKEKAMNAGMDDYVTKPYSPNDLLSAILKQLSKFSNNENKNISSAYDNGVTLEVKQHLASLFKNDQKDIAEFVQMLNIQLPLQLSALNHYIQKENWEAVYLESHKIKSSVRILNVKNLIDLILLIETASNRKSNCEQIPALFEKFNRDALSLVSELKNSYQDH